MNDDQLSDLIDWIEEQQCFKRMFPGYDMNPVDLDIEGCFV
jgi:hypothetical protein